GRVRGWVTRSLIVSIRWSGMRNVLHTPRASTTTGPAPAPALTGAPAPTTSTVSPSVVLEIAMAAGYRRPSYSLAVDDRDGARRVALARAADLRGPLPNVSLGLAARRRRDRRAAGHSRRRDPVPGGAPVAVRGRALHLLDRGHARPRRSDVA